MQLLDKLHPLNLLSGFIAVSILAIPREYLKSWVALLLGDDTPKAAGRLSFNPLIHLDPVGTATFILFDFGWTRQIPLRPWKIKGWKLFVISILGPLLNLTEAIAFARLAGNAGGGFLFDVLYKSAKYSFTYFIFSFFPVPPLDGSLLLISLLPQRYSWWVVKYQVYGPLFMLSLLVLWILPLMMSPFVKMIEAFMKVAMGV